MAGTKTNKSVGVVVACLVALIQTSSSAAATYTVGDTTGWTVPPTSSLYTTWASKNTFKVNDVLVFNFQTGAHTVAEVSKSDYDACSSTNAISSHSTGPASLTISTAGTHYYICTVSGHCSGGQKLAITTATSSSTPSATSPSSSTTPSADGPSSSTTPPPSSSSASVVAGAGFVLPLLLVVAAFLL